jgi:branched-chain amino acid transport system permease protein
MTRLLKLRGLMLLAALSLMPLVLSPYWVNLLTLALVYSLAVYSITLLTGFAGLLSFGQAGFVGVGAYTYGVLSVARMPAFAGALAGVLLPTLLGGLLALPAARLRGHYLAIGTLGFGVLVAQLLNNLVSVTRGPMGLLGIGSMGVSRAGWYYAALIVSGLVGWGLNRLQRGTYLGLLLKSVKHDEIAAAASGVAVFPLKLFAFAASASIAGLCGVMLAAHLRFLTPDLFDTAESFRYLMMAVVGGVGSATGGLISALLLTLVPEILRSLGESNVRLLVYGVMVLFVLWFVPSGIGGVLDRLSAWLSRSTGGRSDHRAGRSRSSTGLAPTTPADSSSDVPRRERDDTLMPFERGTRQPVLELGAISRRFGGVQALQAVDFTGRAGEVHGLIGPNGAGKSTLIGCVTGLTRVDAGRMTLLGDRIDRLAVHERARRGVGRTFQKVRLAAGLSVFDNVAIGLASRQLAARGSWLDLFTRQSIDRLSGTVHEALAEAGIGGLAAEPVGSLPFGTRHFVELARALVASPHVLLLDEPATGLTEQERVRLGAIIRRAAAGGCLVVLVEHDLALVGQLCDRVTVLEYGRAIFTGSPSEAQRDAQVVAAYLGSARFGDARGGNE